MNARSRRLSLVAILVASTVVRLYHMTAPMADTLLAKQAYVANRARSIALPPLNPLRNSLDFLDENGDRMSFTEEVPLYHGLLGVGFRLFGEHDWVGHAFTLIGTLAALVAFFDLARREWDDRSALVATALFSAAPLFVFYGRAVLPETWMVASMLIAAACYRRYLDEGRARWLVAASIAGAIAPLFKYFGLMVMLPLADMAWRKAGTWRGVLSRSFVAMAAVMMAPVMAWMGLVFLQTPNALESGWVEGKALPYFIIQAPEILLAKPFWAGFFSRFLIRDCGPVTLALMILGVIAAIRKRTSVDGFTRAWTVMALGFYVLLGPKLIDHDYYELMMLPAAAMWATMGWRAIRGMSTVPSGRNTASRSRFALATLALAVVVQSPWVSGGFFRQDDAKLALAARLRDLCPADARFVAIGPGIEFPTVVHYSHREGWPVHSKTLPENWRERLDRYRASGARLVAVYFEPKATDSQRASYAPLLRELPLVEHGHAPRARSGGSGEFFILRVPDTVEPRLSREDSPRRARATNRD